MRKFSSIKYAAVLLAAMSLGACQDDETIKDEQLPQISISTQGLDKKVWADLKLTADATDNDQVSKVEFYVDGTLVQTINTAPYEISLDTKKYEDGEHMVKVIAYDQNMNQAVTEKKIEVFNTLMQFKIESGYLNEKQSQKQGIILISDKAGNVIGNQEIVDGKDIVFTRPDEFSDSLFHITIVTQLSYIDYENKMVYIQTYQNMTPGVWILKKQNEEVAKYKATVNVSVPGAQDINVDVTGGVSTSSEGSISNDSKYSGNFDLYSIPQELFISSSYYYEEDSIPSYKYINNMQDGIYDFDYQSFKHMDLFREVHMPGIDYGTIDFYGSNSKDNPSKYINVFSEGLYDGATSAKIYSPDNVFKHYRYTLLMESRTQGIGYQKCSYKDLEATYSLPDFDTKVNKSKLADFDSELGTKGDMFEILGLNISDDDNWLIWSVLGDGNSSSFDTKLNKTLEEIVKKYPSCREKLTGLEYTLLRLFSFDDKISYKHAAINYLGFNELDDYEEHDFIYGQSGYEIVYKVNPNFSPNDSRIETSNRKHSSLTNLYGKRRHK